MRKASAIVLSTTIQRATHYVATVVSTRQFDNSKVVDHTTDPKAAMQFESAAAAATFRSQMVNPHQRDYTVETISLPADPVLVGSRKKLTEASSDHLR